jgi:hypothetical protein
VEKLGGADSRFSTEHTLQCDQFIERGH